MQIQANTVGTQAVAHHSDATTGVGRMGQLDVRQIATGQDAILLGSRSEESLRRIFLNTVPAHQVTTQGYFIAKNETTFAD